MGWISLIGAGLSALSQHQQGQNAKDDANQQARVGQSNALATALRIRRLTRQAQGEAVAAQAASGVDVTTGSPLEVQRDIGQRGELDAYTALLNADAAATLTRAHGSAVASQANAQAGSTLLQGAYDYASKSNWKRSPKSVLGSSSPSTSGGVGATG